jgi:hypothetical protein
LSPPQVASLSPLAPTNVSRRPAKALLPPRLIVRRSIDEFIARLRGTASKPLLLGVSCETLPSAQTLPLLPV